MANVTRGPELRDYLADVSDDRAKAIATRVALRLLPLAFRNRPNVACVRPVFVAWAALYYPGHQELLAVARAAASDSNIDMTDGDVSSAVRNAVAAVARSAGATRGNAGRAAEFAARAVAKERGAEATLWNGINADLRWQELNSSGRLIQQPLWLLEVEGYEAGLPIWVRKPFIKFAESKLGNSGAWKLWLEWYSAILPSNRDDKPQSILGEEKDIEFATKNAKQWERDSETEMAGIADISAWRGRLRHNFPQQIEPPSGDTAPERETQDRLAPSSLPTQQESALTLESVEPQSDEPTADDRLGRRPFAQALVERMDKIYQKGGHDGFAAHIYAPWGAGKTSVLMMMRDLMIAKDRKSVDGKLAPHWVVVRFNAWEQERRNPPWWPLVEAVKNECLQCLSSSRVGYFRLFKSCIKSLWSVVRPTQDRRYDQAAMLQLSWIWWKIRTDLLGYVVALFVTVICSWMLLYSVGTTTELIMKLFAAAVLAFATFTGASRVAFFGSTTAAKLYDDISKDPLTRIVRLFKKIVEKTELPVCIFIDDLDRCRPDYVVDLLEGIQTSFRHKDVAYVVAADRSWIKASFEARYGVFSSAVGSLGQSLGYLFLEKVFQVSTPVPGMGDKTRSIYWNRLLRGTTLPAQNAASNGVSAQQFDDAVETRRVQLRRQHGDNLTREQAETILEKSDTAEDRAAVVLELNASRGAEKEAEHLLAQFITFLPDNPRVMKRMLNAFAMRQAIGILENGGTPSNVLARWTILEQRFPSLADLLIEHPDWIEILSRKIESEDREKLPPLLLPFVNSEIVRSIIGDANSGALSAEHVHTITRGSMA